MLEVCQPVAANRSISAGVTRNFAYKAKAITEDPEAQSDAVIRRQGEALDYDDYASGGIARMLGE